MYKKGEYIMYSCHGCCQVEDISEMVIEGIKKTYYNLRPYGDSRTLIMTPIDNKKLMMRPVIEQAEADGLLSSFGAETVKWIENKNLRTQVFKELIREGRPKELSALIITLRLKKAELRTGTHKFTAVDSGLLKDAEKILFTELAACLGKEVTEIRGDIDEKTEQMKQ